jgi:hypothetical protein
MAFKRIETAWNSRTPVWLHNGTKENYIFQFTLVGVVLGIYIAVETVRDRRERRIRESFADNQS